MLKQLRVVLIFLAVAVMTGCGHSDSDPAITVTVTDSQNKLPGITVVLGDSNGVMKTHGTTDLNGEITFTDPPANATITAAGTCLYSGSTATVYDLDVKYDVNGPVTLSLYNCSPIASYDVGTMTINVTNTNSQVKQNRIVLNTSSIFFWPESLITRQTITVNSYYIQPDGKISTIVTGQDSTGKTIPYGGLVDQPFEDGMSVNITVDQPMSFVNYQIMNLPSITKNIYLSVSHAKIDSSFVTLYDSYSLSSAPSSTTIQMGYIPGLGQQLWYSVTAYFDQNQNGLHESSQSIFVHGTATPSDQSFDLSQALQVPSNLSVSAGGTARPTFSWNAVDSGVADLDFNAELQLPWNPHFYFGLYGLSPNRTSVTFPELPDSLAAFRPLNVQGFQLFASDYSGEISRYSSANYSTQLSYAPALDKSYEAIRSKMKSARR